MTGIVSSHLLKTFGAIPLPIPLSLRGYSLGMLGPIPSFLLGYSLGMLGSIPSFLLGYSLRMLGPIPSLGGRLSRSHGQELGEFRIIVAALWRGRGGSVTALAAAFGGQREMAAVLAGVSVAA